MSKNTDERYPASDRGSDCEDETDKRDGRQPTISDERVEKGDWRGFINYVTAFVNSEEFSKVDEEARSKILRIMTNSLDTIA